MSITTTTIMKCDKCGKLIKYGSFVKVTHRNYLAGKLSILFPNWNSPQEYELCYDCNSKLEEWFRSPTDEQRKAVPWDT